MVRDPMPSGSGFSHPTSTRPPRPEFLTKVAQAPQCGATGVVRKMYLSFWSTAYFGVIYVKFQGGVGTIWLIDDFWVLEDVYLVYRCPAQSRCLDEPAFLLKWMVDGTSIWNDLILVMICNWTHQNIVISWTCVPFLKPAGADCKTIYVLTTIY